MTAKLLYHPTHRRARVIADLRAAYQGGQHGMDHWTADLDRRRADRRQAPVRRDGSEVNRFMWKYLAWEMTVIGVFVLLLKVA